MRVGIYIQFAHKQKYTNPINHSLYLMLNTFTYHP
nr:MAG TPA: hypothetical protein [Caudoviricetes sp.]